MSTASDPMLFHPVIDEVLTRHREALGHDDRTYRHHVYRCANYQRALLGGDPPDAAALAWAVHDLGIWTAGTFDYLAPSAALGERLASEFGIADTALVRTLVLDHHGLGARADPLVETFRVADRIDVSRGLLRGGVDAEFVRQVVELFPYLGFHRFLLNSGLRHAVRHPLRPLPMLRW
ncbi:hypothetical protein [Nocardia neocaledoniensis]|uniref:hypothetical protein n=1 Tax=Nocardia neocaledoniensis TaxID=236511 RepID=UPI002458D1A7|nr:hypothetical protein [Nocardia neocaledoniensis]